MKRTSVVGIAGVVVLLACHGGARAAEPIVGLPCEGCEAVFQGLPEALASESRLAPADEAGEPLTIEGVVRDAAGVARAGIVVYAYQTDARGLYPRAATPAGPSARRHGRLRGWAASDAAGRFRFLTIRPAGYPDSSLPQHVHLHVLEPGRCTYYIDDLLFTDDPRLSAGERRRQPGRGGSGISTPVRDAEGGWRARRDIVLGERVPGYDACGQRAGAAE